MTNASRNFAHTSIFWPMLNQMLSKLLAIVVLMALLAAGAFGIVMPVWQRVQSADEGIAQQRALLGRYLVVAHGAAAQETRAQDIGARPSDVYLPGETDALRLAHLQAVLNDAANNQSIRLASTRVIDISERGGVRLLGLQAQLSGELDPLQKLLYDLEWQRPNLIVDSLTIARGPDGGSVKLPGLDVTFVLAGVAPSKKE